MMAPLKTEPPLAETRAAQEKWARVPVRERLRFVRALRHLIARNAIVLAEATAAVRSRPVAEKLSSEVLPLADVCRWLERRAARILARHRPRTAGRPLWLRGVTLEIERQPFGVILVIGPGNYPLFLPCVQALHALVAGNAVLLKPAPGTRAVALRFAELAVYAGLPEGLLTVLPETVDAANAAIAAGMDKVFFTGSSENGRAVLHHLADRNIPSVMELSGNDAVLVLEDADIELVLRALRFGTRLNAGETCIAPRRVIAVGSAADAVIKRLANEDDAVPVFRAPDASAALRMANSDRFGLGVSIFSRDLALARTLASDVRTGFAVINDLIVPTADPRVPFGGIKGSGFGVTRGEEGLREMTYPHAVITRRGRFHPHFDPPAPGDERLFASWLMAAHGCGPDRLRAAVGLGCALIGKIRNTL